MAEESEKRARAIMDKLFPTPPKSKSKQPPTSSPSQSTSPDDQLLRGEKRRSMESALSVLDPKPRGGVVSGFHNSPLSGGSVQTPLCRPWDRGDLMRRLATFKSMTWFAKPQVVSAVNCARRGWVSVDMDTIACEACGSRIFFSTPSSWTQHQVQKAAMVFSLKLDNGHKLLCPWIDNACDEKLVQFPPTPAEVLVDDYKKRCSSLLHLLALPVISSSAIDYMRSPQLEHFLGGSFSDGCSNEPAETSQTECLGIDTNSALSYYQAQKLISLCGWEFRSLPYIVDCKSQKYQSIKDSNLSDKLSHGHNSSIVVYSSGMDQTMEADDNPSASGRMLFDPNSVVLECKLCGASVGLWTFSTVPRPLELLRLIGSTEVNGELDSAHHNSDAIHRDIGPSGTHDMGTLNHVGMGEGTSNVVPITATSPSERRSNLNLTIAGGPLPTKQNFKATISLPVIGRNLRAWISSESEFKDLQGVEIHRASTLVGKGFQPEDMSLLHDKQVDAGEYNSKSNSQTPCSDDDLIEQRITCSIDKNISTGGAISTGQGIPEVSVPCAVMENSVQNALNSMDRSSRIERLPENSENIATVDPAMDMGRTQVGDSSVAMTGAHVRPKNGEVVEDDSSMTIEAHSSSLQQNLVTRAECSMLVDSQDGTGFEAELLPVNNDVPCSTGKNLYQPPVDKAMEFDPIRQHRNFCPWIASNGNSPPGWQQTLSALQRLREFSCPLSPNTPSSSHIEVDDPLASLKKLFMSPSLKRMKLTSGSS